MRRFIEDERGQSLVFAVITLFGLAMMAMMILGVSESTGMQMRLQNAADAAAYSGAQVEADIVAQVAWMNEGMSPLYYYGMRYCVDTATYATLAELEDVYKEHPAGDKASALGFSEDMNMRWRQAYALARDEVPRCEQWIERLSNLQRGIASIGADLVDRQVRFTAAANGAESVAVYRGFRFSYTHWGSRHRGLTFLPDDGQARRVLDIHKIGTIGAEPWQPNGWQFVGVQPSGSDMTAQHVTHAEPDDYKDDVKAWQAMKWHDEWEFTINENGAVTTMDVHAYYENPGENYPANYLFEMVKPDGSTETRVVLAESPEMVVIIGPNGTVTIDQTGDGMDITDEGGSKVSVRREDDGTISYWDDDGDGTKEEDEWKPIADKESITVNGVEVPVAISNTISMGGATVSITDPIHIHFGRLDIWLTQPLRFDLHFAPFGDIEVRDDWARVHGLRTRDATGRWYDITDVTRHRMEEQVPDQDYRYVWEYVGALMTEMMQQKFAAHGIIENDPDYALAPGDAEYWSVPDEEDAEEWADTGSGGPSLWASYPKWAQPGRDPVAHGDTDLGGFFNIATGQPNPKGDHHLHQTRQCWFCGTQGDVAGPLYDIEPSSPRYWRTINRRCVRPCGFWHLRFGDEDPWQAKIDELNAQGYEVFWVEPDETDGNGQIITPYAGQYVIQVRCPTECKWDFSSDAYPKAYEATLEEVASGLPSIASVPTRVRRSIVDAYERAGELIHGGTRPDNPDQRRMDRGFDSENPVATVDRRDFYALHLENAKTPLELTRYLFTNSINVATWAPALKDRIWQRLGGTREVNVQAGTSTVHDPRTETGTEAWQGVTTEERTGQVNPFEEVDWGHYAVATARLHFPKEDAFGNVEIVHRFDWDGTPIDDYDWDPTYDPEPKWERIRWIQSAVNLFEPDWTARLVQVKEAIDLRDEYPSSRLDPSSGDYVGDSSTALLMRQLVRGSWRQSVLEGEGSSNVDTRPEAGLRVMTAPPMQNGGRINWDSDEDLAEMDEVFQH